MKKRIRVMSVRLTTDDERHIRYLTRELGATSPSDLVRKLISLKLVELKSADSRLDLVTGDSFDRGA